MTPLLRVENLRKAYGRETVFHSVAFEVLSGQHLAVLGPSGCGKSTLLRLLTGLDMPTEGRIWLNEQVISEPGRILVPPHCRQMALVFQDLALWPTLTARENVLLGMAGLRLNRADREAQALEALKTCKLEALAGRKPGMLSVGQQQRVALARALAVRPKLLLLDEPFSGLDVVLKQELSEEIRRLCSRFEITRVLVTHDPWEALGLCSQAIVLEEGRCLEQGPLGSISGEPGVPHPAGLGSRCCRDSPGPSRAKHGGRERAPALLVQVECGS